MKKKFLIVSGLFSLMTLTGCSNDDKLDVPDETTTRSFIMTIKDVRGLMAYNNNIQRWFVMCDYPNTYDRVDNYFPLKIEDEYKVPGLSVIISGEVCGKVPNLPLLGGHENYNIELTKIEKAE